MKVQVQENSAQELTRETFAALRQGEISTIVLNDVITASECDRACEVIRHLTRSSSYEWSSDLTVIGTSVGEAHETPAKEEKYFSEAPSTAAILRNEVFPFGSPVSRIMQQLLLLWPAGVQVPMKAGRHFLPEIVRRWISGGGAHPHIDQTQTHLLGPLGIGPRIGLNIYLSMPESGGSIEFWKRTFSDAEYERLKRPDYGVDRSLLGTADMNLRPRRGQAVLFRAWEPHAVETVIGPPDRITSAAFICATDTERPLAMFA